MRSPFIFGLSGVPAGKTVSKCAESTTTGPVFSGGNLAAGSQPKTLLAASVSTLLRPALAKRAANHSARACSPKGGAGMATTSACKSMIVLGLPCSQAKAVWTDRRRASAVTCEKAELGKESAMRLASG